VTIQARGIPAASEPYLISDTRLRSVSHQRGYGDLRITLEDLNHVSLVVLTQDPRVLRDLRRRVEETRDDLVRLRLDLATHEFQLTQAVSQRLVSLGAIAEMPPQPLRDDRRPRVSCRARYTRDAILGRHVYASVRLRAHH
jgi:hypothetical protein